MRCSSELALVQAIREELGRAGESSPHGFIHVSCAESVLRNGIRRCSVQVECDAGCGSLVEAYGEEADILQQEAIAIQKLLNRSVEASSAQFQNLFPILLESNERRAIIQ